MRMGWGVETGGTEIIKIARFFDGGSDAERDIVDALIYRAPMRY